MPRYDYTCPAHGDFEAVAGIEDKAVLHDCGRLSVRRAVYAGQGVIFRGQGFTKTAEPPPGSADAQQEGFKELRRRGWDADRAVGELRKATVTNEKTGKKAIDFRKMTKEA